jgi:tetratricopeptide (TPR) repeat protein
MKNKKFIIGFFLGAAALLSNHCYAETVTLKTGQKIEGDVIEITEKYIKVDVAGVPMTYFMDELEGADAYIKRPKNEKKDISPVQKAATPDELKGTTEKAVFSYEALPEYRQAVLLASQEKYSEAEEAFKKILEADKFHVYSKIALKILLDINKGVIDKETCHLFFQGENSVLEGRTNDAVAFVKAALDKNPGYAESNAQLAKIYLMAGQYKPAELYFQKAISLSPQQNPIYYFGLVNVYVHFNDYEKARVSLLKAATLFQAEGNTRMAKDALDFAANLPKQ